MLTILLLPRNWLPCGLTLTTNNNGVPVRLKTSIMLMVAEQARLLSSQSSHDMLSNHTLTLLCFTL